MVMNDLHPLKRIHQPSAGYQCNREIREQVHMILMPSLSIFGSCQDQSESRWGECFSTSATVILAGKRCFFDDDYLAFARGIMEMKSELVPLRRSLNHRTSFSSANSIEKISQASVWT